MQPADKSFSLVRPIRAEKFTCSQQGCCAPINAELDPNRFGMSIDEIEDKCKTVFNLRDRRANEDKRTRRIQMRRLRQACRRQDISVSRRPRHQRLMPTPRLPSVQDSYVRLLEVVLKTICEKDSEGNFRLDWFWGTDNYYIERSILHVLYAHQFNEHLITTIDNLNRYHRLEFWPRGWYQEISNLWYHSFYILTIKKNNVEMTSVDRFRIRKRHPCPLEQIVGKTKYSIPATAISLFNEVYADEQKPNKVLKLELSSRTGLTEETISNWFKNKRQRERRISQLCEQIPPHIVCPADTESVATESKATSDPTDASFWDLPETTCCRDAQVNHGNYYDYPYDYPYQGHASYQMEGSNGLPSFA